MFVQYCDRCGKIATSKAIPAIGSKGLAFSQNYDETYSVFVGTCTDAEVVIPATYEGEPVTSIGSSAFEDCDNLRSVYYQGTAEDWAKIGIDSNNIALFFATRYYYSETQPTTEGNYWHYDENGEIVVW